jgi:hypothetical protein
MGITVHILTQYISGALNCCFKTRVSLHFKLRTLFTVNDKFGNVCKYCDSVYYILSGINNILQSIHLIQNLCFVDCIRQKVGTAVFTIPKDPTISFEISDLGV